VRGCIRPIGLHPHIRVVQHCDVRAGWAAGACEGKHSIIAGQERGEARDSKWAIGCQRHGRGVELKGQADGSTAYRAAHRRASLIVQLHDHGLANQRTGVAEHAPLVHVGHTINGEGEDGQRHVAGGLVDDPLQPISHQRGLPIQSLDVGVVRRERKAHEVGLVEAVQVVPQ